MSGAPDLTRWNRAGLSRFRYLDLNAAGYFEALRLVLRKRFPKWEDLGGAPPDDESDTVRLARLLAQYFEEEPRGSAAGGRTRQEMIRLRRDPAWQIARSAARALHVLGEHLDAYANEGFLRTAAEREHLRRLVALLDFHPAPPASAATVLVLAAKGTPGTVEAGFQVQHVPPDGGPPIVFETREDLAVDPALNAVRLDGWNRSPKPLSETTSPSPWIAPEESEISTGQVGLLVREEKVSPQKPEEAAVVTIGDMDQTTRRFILDPPIPPKEWTKGETRLLARPERIERPRLNGPGVVSLAAPHDLAVGDVVAWQAATWLFTTVLEADERAVRLAGAKLPDSKTEIFRAVPSRRVRVEKENEIFLPLDFRAAAQPMGDGFQVLDPKNENEIKN